MPALRLRYQTIEFEGVDIHVRTLRDTRQFTDDDDAAAQLGISSAMWPIFGVVWASGQALARLMVDYEVDGRRVLEVGCGIGLASLVLNHRHADITATDRHPEAEGFLRANVVLNEGEEIPFVRTGWSDDVTSLGEFDLIVGSDLLYEADQVDSLSTFIDQHARAICEVVIMDPSRGNGGRFSKRMVGLGYRHSQRTAETPSDPAETYRGQVHTYNR